MGFLTDIKEAVTVGPRRLRQALRDEQWANAVSRLGRASHDPTVYTAFEARRLILTNEAVALYAQDGIVRRAIDLAVDDASRRGFEVDVDEPEGREETPADKAIEDRLQATLARIPVHTGPLDVRRGTLLALNRCEKWARLQGGAACLIVVDDGSERPSEPLDPARVRAVKHLVCIPKDNITASTVNNDPDSEGYGTVELWQVTRDKSTTELWHSSRVLLFRGMELPPIPTAVSSWPWYSVSCLDAWYAELRGSGVTEGAAVSLMQRAVTGIWSIKGLADILADGGEDTVFTRIQQQLQKLSLLRVFIMDKDDESFQPLSWDWSGFATILDRNPRLFCAVSGYPYSLFYTDETGGLNSGGHVGDRRNYYEGVVKGGIQEAHWRAHVEYLVELVKNAEGLQNVPTKVKWHALSEPTDKEQAEVELIEARTKQVLADIEAMSLPMAA